MGMWTRALSANSPYGQAIAAMLWRIAPKLAVLEAVTHNRPSGVFRIMTYPSSKTKVIVVFSPKTVLHSSKVEYEEPSALGGEENNTYPSCSNNRVPVTPLV